MVRSSEVSLCGLEESTSVVARNEISFDIYDTEAVRRYLQPLAERFLTIPDVSIEDVMESSERYRGRKVDGWLTSQENHDLIAIHRLGLSVEDDKTPVVEDVSPANQTRREQGHLAWQIVYAGNDGIIENRIQKAGIYPVPAELVSQCQFAIAQAVETFDPKLGAFSTYASSKIDRFIQKVRQKQSTPFNIPANLHWAARRLSTIDEPEKRAVVMVEIIETYGFSPEIIEAAELALSVDSLEKPNDEGQLRIDIVPSNEPLPESVVEQSQLYGVLLLLLNQLDQRSLRIVSQKFGIEVEVQNDRVVGWSYITLLPSNDEIGEKEGLSREGVRQIFNKATEFMRHSSVARKYRGLL
jgi:RNA polymerase sigma factor (sigma-70 family)